MTVAAIRLGGPPVHPFVEMLSDSGVRVSVVWLKPRSYLQERREIAALCRHLQPDVVHTHGFRTDLVDRQVAARLGIPTITTVHGRDRAGGPKGAFYEWLQRRNFRHFDAVVAVSSRLRDAVLAEGVPAERLHYIPNTWSGLREPRTRAAARTELGLPADSKVVGWVGRLIPVKGGDIFLDALALLQGPRPTGVMIGYGPEAERLQERAAALGLTDSVKFYADIRDAGRLFAAFDTYVLSSRSEGIPISILEAMASRTPIVAARVGGIPDVLDDTEAYLVAPEDPRAVAQAIAKSLEDSPGSATRADLASKRLRSQFTLETWLDRYEEVYRAVSERMRT